VNATFAAATKPARLARRLATPRTALVLAALALAVAVTAVAVTVVDHNFRAGDGGSAVLIPGFGLVGLVVARRQPRNPIGWCLLGCALFLSVDNAASSYSVLVYHLHHASLPLGPVAVLLQPSWAPGIVLLALSILLFPDGDLPGGWWRLPVGVFLASAGVWLGGAYAIAADAIVSHDIRVDSTGNLLQTNHPSGPWAWWGISQGIFFGLLGAVGVAWLVGRVPAYRRAAGVRRAQLKWLLSGAATALVGGALTIAFSPSSGILAVVGFAGTVGLLGLPIGIGIGILRYRLYEIDRLISRTLSYALLTGLLVGVFAGLVLLTTQVLPFSSPVGVAAATLATAGLFAPLRGRLQRLVDRRFNRSRYDAEATVAAFAARLRNAADVEIVLAELAAAAIRSLEPAHVTVWLRP
jgi:hypothetical protein